MFLFVEPWNIILYNGNTTVCFAFILMFIAADFVCSSSVGPEFAGAPGWAPLWHPGAAAT